MTNLNTTTARRIARRAQRHIVVDPSHVVRLDWLRTNYPDLAAYVEERAATQLSTTAAMYPRTAMMIFSQLVMGR